MSQVKANLISPMTKGARLRISGTRRSLIIRRGIEEEIELGVVQALLDAR